MKTTLFRPVALAASLLVTCALVGRTEKSGLVAHEWGTFTSLQGSDGVPIKWYSLNTAGLPGFVYNWYQAGFDRQPRSPFFGSVFSKAGAAPTLQRMETPVIYFYSDRERTVDVSVNFPEGLITEWYPQAGTIGPSAVPPSQAALTIDGYLAKLHVPANIRASALFSGATVTKSVIGWNNVKVLPTISGNDTIANLRTDMSGSHYFAARGTDSAELLVKTSYKTNHTSEHEKFLFYRGLGNFATPLTVKMPSDGAVTMVNTGAEPLGHLFILTLSKSRGEGNLNEIESLEGHSDRSVTITASPVPMDYLVRQICADMAKALVNEGLYPREAAAMVNTWKDSWFAEEGTRVLYVLPRSWTDKTLPLQMSPNPTELVRVMVGRAEVLSPGMERAIAAEKAASPNGSMVGQVYQSLGRFGPAAWQRAGTLVAAKQP